MICSKKSDFNYTEYAAPLHNTILFLSYLFFQLKLEHDYCSLLK